MPNPPQPRRLFLRNAALAALATTTCPTLAFAQSSASLTLLGGQPGPLVPADFIGLSYENMQLEDPTFFSPRNRGLVEQFRKISPRGVLRLGGNTSEFGWWQATPAQVAPHRVDSPWKATGEPTAATTFPITPEAIDNLAGFLEATGWTCIYGLNLGYGTPATDVPEAVYVANKLGSRLAYFQVGNEVDLFRGHLRDPATWNVGRYLEEWLTIARAVQHALPTARFGMPDVAGQVAWLPQISALWPAVENKPNVITLSHHYYWSGPPSNPQATIANLLKQDPKVTADAATTAQASHALGPQITWRMTEGNTVYRGGKSGLSDAFASALWAADYLMQLMSFGYCGVNLHGGSGHAQAVSVGGTFVGESLMRDPTEPHPKPFYTPIANVGTLAGAGVEGKLSPDYVLEPVGVGMQFVAPFAGSTLLPLTFNPGGVNVTAYAARKDGKTLLLLLNKDASEPLTLTLPPAKLLSILQAPNLDSREAHIVEAASSSTVHIYTLPAHTGAILELQP